jgi:hypothetical protein
MINKDKNKPEDFENFLVNEVIEERDEMIYFFIFRSCKAIHTSQKQ